MAVLSEVLGRSSTARRVLSLLSSIPGRELHTREIARRAAADIHSVQLALDHLLATGTIVSRRVGPLRMWAVDPQSPKLRAVRDLLRREGDIVKVLSEGVARMPDVRLALLFGSFASGEDIAGSDIDVLIVGAVDWDRLARLGERASASVGREVNFVTWTHAELAQLASGQRRLLDSILRHPRILLKGDEGQLATAAGRRVATALAARHHAEGTGPQPRARKVAARAKPSDERRADAGGAEARSRSHVSGARARRVR